MNKFKIFLLTCAVVIGSVSCSSKKKERFEWDLFPVPHISHKKYNYGDSVPKYKDKDRKPVSGYIDRDGQLAINLQFDFADEFSGGLARVVTDKKFGFINTNGEFVIKPQFDDAENFGVGDAPLALVKVGDKYGYIDKSGNYAVIPQFDDAGSFTIYFSEVPGKWNYSLAGVKVGDKWGFIDKSGNYVITPQFGMVGSFSEGRALAKVGDKCGYIDETGEMVIAAQFECASEHLGLSVSISEFGEFSGGFACVRVASQPTQIQTPAKLPTKDSIATYPKSWKDFINTYPKSLVAEPKYKYGFIDRTGKFVIEPQFDVAGDFSNGLAAVGFIQNLTVLSMREVSIEESLSKNIPKQIVKWGFINETGRFVINPMFDRVKEFTRVRNTESRLDGQSLAAVVSDEGNAFACGYIDKTGKYVANPQFLTGTYPLMSNESVCNGFSAGGFAYFGSNNRNYSVIDNTGKIIFSYHD